MDARQVTRLNIAGFAAFNLAYLSVKLAAVSAAHYDYAKEIYNAQALRWFYEAANPPIYTWLLHGLFQITGPGVEAALALTHALLFAALLAAFGLGRRLLGSAADGALAAWLLLTVHQVFRFQFARTHSLLLVLFGLLALLVFVGMLRQRRTRDYVLLGLVLGAGLLSKFTFAGFIGALVLGALATREGRRALVTPRLALTVVALLAVTLPVALAGLDQWTVLAEIFKLKTAPATQSGDVPARLAALLGLVGALLAFAAVPVLAMAAAMGAVGVGGRLRRPAGREVATAPGQADFDTGALRLLVAVMLAGIAILIVAVLAGAVARVSGRFLLAFLLPLPFVIAALARRHAPGRAGLRACGIAIAAVLVVQATVRVIDLSPFCSGKCTDLAPYDRLAVRLRGLGFLRGAITTLDVSIAGNLVAALPGSAATVRGLRGIARPPLASRARCLIVWRADARGATGAAATRPPASLINVSGLAWIEALDRARIIAVPWRWVSRDRFRPFAEGRRRTSSWGILLLRQGQGACR